MLAEAAVCVALATVPSQELKKEFETYACADHLLRADLTMEGDHMDLTFTAAITREQARENPEVEGGGRVPMATMEAASLAFKTAHHIAEMQQFASFQWTIQDRNGKYLCTIHIENEEVKGGDCSGLVAGK